MTLYYKLYYDSIINLYLPFFLSKDRIIKTQRTIKSLFQFKNKTLFALNYNKIFLNIKKIKKRYFVNYQLIPFLRVHLCVIYLVYTKLKLYK